jgi:uncharacterized protein YdeI (YjbR/CyaY-like superfamily)
MENKRPNDWLICNNHKEWRNWLIDHHLVDKEVWLEIKKAKSTLMGMRLHEAVEQALCFGWIDGRMYSIDSGKFIIHVSKRRKNGVWSLVNKRRAIALIADNQMMEAGYQSIEQAKKNGMWDQAYTSKDAAHMESIFIHQLRSLNVAYSYYETLSHIDRLHIVMWLEQCRTNDSLDKRISVVVNKLETQAFHELSQLIF